MSLRTVVSELMAIAISVTARWGRSELRRDYSSASLVVYGLMVAFGVGRLEGGWGEPQQA